MEYKSENGYSGVLYGTSSMTVFNPEGKAVLHTGNRNVQTFDELKVLVDTMPEFMEKLMMLIKEGGKDD